MGTSKLQREVSKELSIHFGAYTIRENIRPEWLITRTGQRLELDFFIKEFDVAIEVQGKQHYCFTPYFHKNYDDFKQQQNRDDMKRSICQKRGIRLIEISSQHEIDEMLSEIKPKLEIDRENQIDHIAINNELANLAKHINKSLRRRKHRNPKQLRELEKHRNRIMNLIDYFGISVLQTSHPNISNAVMLALKTINEIEIKYEARRLRNK